ncbi:hypothetical protein AJ79_01650 [Helicocarpus griseus UAMH5409]|uniref:RNase III domain-containing protein n=1 Tax=Helicocarpus griseus UAMH5409 TaxID=1447875 RepID=A0A2B7XXN2_9EURO|nr:hypothetical protein AJ79_01650 [Helicocarpus griseus UAMH5409]
MVAEPLLSRVQAMNTKRKFEAQSGETAVIETSTKKQKATKGSEEISATKKTSKEKKEGKGKKNAPTSESKTKRSISPPGAERDAENLQSRLARLERLTSKLLTQTEQIPSLLNSKNPGKGEDAVRALVELGRAFGLEKATSDRLYHNISCKDKVREEALRLSQERKLPPLPALLDPELEAAVFTHQGYVKDSEHSLPGEKSYERLEHLGDAYIQSMSTRLIWDSCPRAPAGCLARIREDLVNNDTLGQFAGAYGLDRRLLLDPRIRNEPKRWMKIKGDIFEAYVGAVILSHRGRGVEVAEEWLAKLWIPRLEKHGDYQPDMVRYKEELSKRIMDKGVKITYYDEKPPIQETKSSRRYFLGVKLTGYGYDQQHLGSGQGISKGIAGNEAAKAALENPLLPKFMALKQAQVQARREQQAAAAAPA